MAKSLDAELAVALTGTPVENSLTDLWSIIDTVQPGALGSHTEFKSTYAKPAEADVTALEPLRRKLEADSTPQILLRRMKQDHLTSLPIKHEYTYAREMPPEQADAYRSAVVAAQAAAGRAGSVLEALQGLRRVSLLPDAALDLGLTDMTVRQSARLSALLEILDKVSADGEKALVFVEFLKIQEALVPYLRQRYDLPRDPLRIYGGTPSGRRMQHVDAFQHGAAGAFDVMLLSPKAAGVGLTLTAANHVIHLSRWWNPAVEDQCTDRVFRIGQQRDVHVHLPMAVHPTYGERSFDANLHRLLKKKRTLSNGLFAPPTASSAEIAQLADDCIASAPRA
jgi:SNF2 family DNA or RNA helicase